MSPGIFVEDLSLLLKKTNPQRASNPHYEERDSFLGKIVQELHRKRGKRYYHHLGHPNLDPEHALGRFIHALTEYVHSRLQSLYGSSKYTLDSSLTLLWLMLMTIRASYH